MNVLNWVLSAFLLIGALAGTIFMIIYTYRWHWWKDEHGLHLGTFTLSLTLVMWVYVFRPLFEPTTFALIRAVLFTAIVVGMVWRVVLLFRSDHRKRPVNTPNA